MALWNCSYNIHTLQAEFDNYPTGIIYLHTNFILWWYFYDYRSRSLILRIKLQREWSTCPPSTLYIGIWQLETVWLEAVGLLRYQTLVSPGMSTRVTITRLDGLFSTILSSLKICTWNTDIYCYWILRTTILPFDIVWIFFIFPYQWRTFYLDKIKIQKIQILLPVLQKAVWFYLPYSFTLPEGVSLSLYSKFKSKSNADLFIDWLRHFQFKRFWKSRSIWFKYIYQYILI